MNYLARICLGALSSPLIFPLPAFFSLQFPFDLRLFFSSSPEPHASFPKCLFFSTAPVPIAPGSFCRVSLAALEKSFVKPILYFVPEAAAKKSLYSLILCVSLY